MTAGRTSRMLLAWLVLPGLLLAACATGTDPGAGGADGSDGSGDSGVTSPDAPVTSSPGDGSSESPDPSTPAVPIAAELTVSLDETGTGAFQTWTLTCDPAGGDHPDAEAACAALAAAGVDAFAPIPRDAMCTEIYGGPQVAHVEGTVDGTRVSADFGRSNGCEIAKWDPLAPLLGSVGGVER